MHRHHTHLPKAAFSAGFIGVGLPYWLIPYGDVNLPNALYGPGLVVVAGAAMLLHGYGLARFWRAAGLMTMSVPAAVFARVIVEGLQDPTSHNLWPLELIIATAVGFVPALGGAVLGHLPGALSLKRTGERS
jgi:hypothetical protein